MDFRVGLGEIRERLVSRSGLDWVAGVQAAVPCGRARSNGAEPGGSMRIGAQPPSHIFPTVSPVPARDRARHRTGKHMKTEVSRGRQAVSLEPGSLPEEPFKALIPPGPHPCPAGTQMLAKALPLLPGGRTTLSHTQSLWKGRESEQLLLCRPSVGCTGSVPGA